MQPALRGALCAFVVGLPAVAHSAPLSADDIVRSALARHPEAVASDGVLSAARAARREVGTFLENPEGDLSAGSGGLREAGFLQPLSLTGEGWHARSAAGAAIDAAGFERERTRLILAREARAAFARAVTADAAWRLADDALEQATRLREGAEARVNVGEASLLDVRLARLGEAEAAGRAIETRRAQADARIALARFAPDAVAAELAGDPMGAVPPSSGGVQRSDRQAAEASVREAERHLARERAAAVPKLGVGAWFEPAALGPQIAVGIPLWARNQGATAGARAERDLARAELVVLDARIAAEQATAPETATYATEAFGRLGDFEADARAALVSIELGWTTGELDLSDAVLLRREVLDGWSSALEARLSTVEAQLDALLATDDQNLLPPGAP